MNATEKIMDFVNRIKTLEFKLEAVGYTVDADEKRRIFLRGVREEYGIPVQVIRSSGLEFDKAISDLIVFEAEAEIREGRDFGDDGSSALSMNHRNGCHFCGTPIPNGIQPHTTQDCFYNPNGRNFKSPLAQKRNSRNQRRGSNQKGQKRNRNGNNAHRGMNNKNHGNQADDGKGALSYLDFTFVAHRMKMGNALDSTFKDKCFADSGATMHMSNNKNVFYNLDTSHRQDVSVWDGESNYVPWKRNRLCPGNCEFKEEESGIQ